MRLVRFSMLAIALLMSGCASQLSQQQQAGKPITRPIYLRGVFTWWDAEPQYLMHAVKGHPRLWMAQAELVADGKPYEFKIGDKDWRCGTDFGYLTNNKPLQLGERRDADSCAQFNSFQFTPKQDGTYQFYLDNSGSQPQVYVTHKGA